MPQTDEKAKEYMAVLTEKSTKLARLVEDLIEASKLSSGNITLHPMVLDPGRTDRPGDRGVPKGI